jgi:RNA polymerase sigma factor (sigma-70 family)
MAEDDDELTRLRDGEKKIWNKIYNKYRPDFIAQAIKKPHIKREDAEDAFQEMLEKFHKKLQVDEVPPFEKGMRSYLFSMYKNQLIDAGRKKTSMSSVFDDENDIIIYADSIAEILDKPNPRLPLFMKCYRALPVHERNFVDACLLHKCDMEAVALATGLKNANVASQTKFKLKIKILKMMEEMEDL